MNLADYLLDNYGSCALQEKCVCLPGIWVGRSCPNWTPLGATSWEELRDATHKAAQAGDTIPSALAHR